MDQLSASELSSANASARRYISRRGRPVASATSLTASFTDTRRRARRSSASTSSSVFCCCGSFGGPTTMTNSPRRSASPREVGERIGKARPGLKEHQRCLYVGELGDPRPALRLFRRQESFKEKAVRRESADCQPRQ